MRWDGITQRALRVPRVSARALVESVLVGGVCVLAGWKVFRASFVGIPEGRFVCRRVPGGTQTDSPPPPRRMSGRYDGCFGRVSFLSLFFSHFGPSLAGSRYNRTNKANATFLSA